MPLHNDIFAPMGSALRLCLIALGFAVLVCLAGCSKDEPALTVSPEMREQLILTAANTNRSVFSAPLNPVEVKRTHLVDAWAWYELAEESEKSVDGYVMQSLMNQKPWMLESRPFQHRSGDVVLTFTADPSDEMPELEMEYSPEYQVELTKWMFQNVTPARMYSLDVEGNLIGEKDFDKVGMAMVSPDPYHEFALIMVSLSEAYVERIIERTKEDPTSLTHSPDAKYDIMALSPSGEQVFMKRSQDLGVSCSPTLSGLGFFTLGEVGELGYREDLTLLTPGFKRQFKIGLGSWTVSSIEESSGTYRLTEDEAGTLYFDTEDKQVQAVSADGHKKWKADLGLRVCSAPAVLPDGSLMVVSDDFDLMDTSQTSGRIEEIYDRWNSIRVSIIKLDSSGKEVWRRKLNARSACEPAVSTTGRMFIVLQQSVEHNASISLLAAIDSDGTIAWSRELETSESMFRDSGQAGVDARGNVVAQVYSHIYYYSPSGERLWHLGPDELVADAFVILPDNRLFVYGGGDAVILGERGATNAGLE